MKSIFLSIGSNIEPHVHVPACLQKLKTTFRVKKISPAYETQPVGPAGNKKFWNLAAEVETDMSASEFSAALRTLEESLGRMRSGKNKFEPRTIDIDILPQKNYQRLAFIMIPLADISPDTVDPETGKSFAELAGELREEGKNFKRMMIPESSLSQNQNDD